MPLSEGYGWVKKYLIELLLTVGIMVMAWEGRQILHLTESVTELNTVLQYELTIIKGDIEHIEDAVNNVTGDEGTLREVVEENRGSIGILLERTKDRYKDR